MEQHKWTKAAVIAALIIVLNLFANYAISLIFPEPTMQYYTAGMQIAEIPNTKETCLDVGGQWTPLPEEQKQFQPGVKGYCDPDFTNRKVFEEATAVYGKKVFTSLVLWGLLSIALGLAVQHSLLRIAFVWGGVVSLLIASMRYWSTAGALLKLTILALALAGLIALAVKKFGK